MALLLWMLWANWLGDFSLQSDFLVKWKGKSWYVAVVHASIWAGCVCLPPMVLSRAALGR